MRGSRSLRAARLARACAAASARWHGLTSRRNSPRPLTKNGALELTPSGIRVNAILPGLVQTPLTKRLFDNADIQGAFMERIPQGRAAQPEEIDEPELLSGALQIIPGMVEHGLFIGLADEVIFAGADGIHTLEADPDDSDED